MILRYGIANFAALDYIEIEQHCCIIERRQKLLKHIIDLQIPAFIQDITS